MNRNVCWAGVDIGGTNTEVGFLDSSGNFLLQAGFPTNAEGSPQKFVDKLRDVLDSNQAQLTHSHEFRGIGLAAPNVNYVSGLIESPVNFDWGTINLVDLLAQHYDIPIRIMKDANAAALGEMKYGLAQGMKNFVVITLGTGLGSGIVVNGELVHGANGLAGEIGHTVAINNGRRCACGRQGCLETYTSANGLRRTTLELMSTKSYNSELREISFNDLTAKMISDAAGEGDQLALAVLDFTAQILGRKLADVVAFLDPEAFIVMGGVARTGDLLLAPTREYFEAHLLTMYKGKVSILRSNMKDGQAAILGAATLVFDANEKHE